MLSRRAIQIAEGVEQAFDYRGDVTIKLKTGDQIEEGYVYDRQGFAEIGNGRSCVSC